MWEIFAYQNSDSLFGIFNASAALMGSHGYQNSLAIVAIVGFFAAFFAYVVRPELLTGWKWLAMVVLVSSVLVVPRVTVGIVDKTGGGPEQIVDNVPFGVAVLGSLTSRVGNTLTELFETAFQVLPGSAGLPTELTYQGHGLVFGDRLIRDTRTLVLQDPATRTDLINFVNNCTLYDLTDGTLDPAAFASSDNVWPLMGTPNPARFTPVATAPGVYTTMTCPDAYRSLDGRMPAQITVIERRLAMKLNPTLPPAVALAAIGGQVEQAYLRDGLTTAASSAADIVRQNALINAIDEANQVTGQRLNDPASLLLSLGRSQATAQANASWINAARMAEQALPIFRNTIEAVTYAVYPLMVLLLFIVPLREAVGLVRTYALVLVWIQLWPPLYAVLNYVASVYGAHELAAAAEIGGGAKALSIQTAGSIYSTAISSAAAVGGMVTSIPFIAWGLVRGLSSYGTSLMQSMSVLNSATQRDSAANATGDISLGNTTMDQRMVTPTTSNPFVSRLQTANGDWLTRDALGREAVAKLSSSGYASRIVSARVSEQSVKEASHSADAARSEAVAASVDRSAVLSSVLSSATAWSRSQRSSTSETSSDAQEMGKAASHLDQISQQVANRTGIDRAEVQALAFNLSASIGAGVGLGNAGVGVRGGASSGKTFSSALTVGEQKVLSNLTADDLSAFKRFTDRVTRDSSVLHAFSSDSSQGNELSARLSSATGRVERAERAFAEKRMLAERLSEAHESGEVLSVDLSRSPDRAYLMQRYSELADRYGEDSSAVQILLSNELALRSLRPIASFGDGSAVPASFNDLRRQFETSKGDSDLQPGAIDAAARNNEIKVRGSSAKPSKPTDRSSSVARKVRQGLLSNSSALPNAVQKEIETFDQRHEIVREADGTVHSPKSQLKENIRDLAADVKGLFDGDEESKSKSPHSK